MLHGGCFEREIPPTTGGGGGERLRVARNMLVCLLYIHTLHGASTSWNFMDYDKVSVL